MNWLTVSLRCRYVGLALAVTSTLAIGTSFVITKKGLNEASARHGFEGDGFSYFKSPMWWAGMITMVLGEVANFAAYAFAPAILVTPLGALSVLIGAVLGAYFLEERLGLLGKIGCAICLIGSVIIVLHAPPDKEITTIDEILHYAIQPGFMLYCIVVGIFSVVMIYQVSPRYGRKNPLVYLSICSTVGSVSIMAVKAFGIALKLTLGGNNQFTHPSTYVFAIVVVVCILTQMNYFNKALSQFSTSLVNPLYYVTFTTFTLIASFILFKGFNTTSAVNTISLLCGFLVIFSGVYLLNLSRDDPDGHKHLASARSPYAFHDAVPTDGIGAIGTRRSMQLRRESIEQGLPLHSPYGVQQHHRRVSSGSNYRASLGDREGLMRSYEADSAAAAAAQQRDSNTFGLGDLTEDSEGEGMEMEAAKRDSFDEEERGGGANGSAGGGAGGGGGRDQPTSRAMSGRGKRIERDSIGGRVKEGR
ncbi:magnesium transporter NIPA-domain-containing protein [Lineolata rhizophorae]|uniref:Magnesium transporter NIPA-domain-containing protein n=1 Tax=Lineolata rhizophorae TaxID=578093 RepID=A0A6A6PCS3_9PEZI|nr:magnesium transporter NIPA-domain-containing protein [Lineolata rhizophorae]